LQVQKVKSNFTDDSLDILAKVFVPDVFVTGEFKGNIVFGASKFNSRGELNATLSGVKIKIGIRGSTQGVYMNVNNFAARPDANELKISIQGLFPDPELSKLQKKF
jgi:hypothetical protein